MQYDEYVCMCVDVIKTALFEHNRLRQMHGVPDLKWDFKVNVLPFD